MTAMTVAEDAGLTPGNAHAVLIADFPDAEAYSPLRAGPGPPGRDRRARPAPPGRSERRPDRGLSDTVGGVSTGARTVRTLVATTAGVVLLAGCGGGGGDDEAAGSSSATSSSAAETSPPDLASGLLTAEAFPDDATVVAVSLEQLRAGAGLGALGKDLTITPEECAPAVQGTQPDLDAFDDVSGLSATSPAGVTVEILMRGGPTTGAVDLLSAAVEQLPAGADHLAADRHRDGDVRADPGARPRGRRGRAEVHHRGHGARRHADHGARPRRRLRGRRPAGRAHLAGRSAHPERARARRRRRSRRCSSRPTRSRPTPWADRPAQHTGPTVGRASSTGPVVVHRSVRAAPSGPGGPQGRRAWTHAPAGGPTTALPTGSPWSTRGRSRPPCRSCWASGRGSRSCWSA